MGAVKGFRGWNVVVYDKSPTTEWLSKFGKMSTWYNENRQRHLRIDYVHEGRCRGSFAVRGAEEWNILHCHLKREVLHGRITSDYFHSFFQS